MFLFIPVPTVVKPCLCRGKEEKRVLNDEYQRIAPSHLRAQRRRVDWQYLHGTLFVLPVNDGEAVRARHILTSLPAPYIYCSTQRWGAILEKDIAAIRSRLTADITTVCIMEIPGQTRTPQGTVICEQQLLDLGYRLDIIDHHYYDGLDRRHPLSSLEQLCAKINWQLSETDYHIAVNDRSFIPGLLDLGLSLAQIRAIREFDLLAQGYHPASLTNHIQQANELIDTAKIPKHGDLHLLEKPLGVTFALINQELALRHPQGLVNIYEKSKKKIGFSGNPDLVDRLLGRDYGELGIPAPWVTYGGGDPRYGQFFGLKTASPISTACHERIADLILREF